ncbi:MAG: hypothetical protein ACRD4H_02685 [Candidatus Acidiferrales bacterium]
MTDAQKARERALEDAVSRAVRDNLPPLQRTLEDMQQAFADLVSSCSSARPTNVLPAMLRAQATAASLSASLSVLSAFITNAMQRRDRELSREEDSEDVSAVGVAVAQPEPAETIPAPAIVTPAVGKQAPVARASAPPAAEVEEMQQERPVPPIHAHESLVEETAAEEEVTEEVAQEKPKTILPEPARVVQKAARKPVAEPEPAVEETAPEIAPAEPEPVEFKVAALAKDEQDLHKRANRVAKVSMQDIKMLRPEEVRKGIQHKDICIRLRDEIDKARREYDRRFQKILDQPVDYFHHWMVEILAGGDPEALGEYPYPSPVLHR